MRPEDVHRSNGNERYREHDVGTRVSEARGQPHRHQHFIRVRPVL